MCLVLSSFEEEEEEEECAMNYLALIVLMLGVSVYQCREEVENFCHYWLPAYYKRRLEPLVHKIPHIRIEISDGIEVSVTRGRSAPDD